MLASLNTLFGLSETFRHEGDCLPGWPEGLMTSISAPFRR